MNQTKDGSPSGRLEGTLMVRGKGTGFLRNGEKQDDIVIAREQLGTALDGDTTPVSTAHFGLTLLRTEKLPASVFCVNTQAVIGSMPGEALPLHTATR